MFSAKKSVFTIFNLSWKAFVRRCLKGLSRKPKQIPPKFFYDETGSKLFEAILEQPEYYIPNIERELIQKHVR